MIKITWNEIPVSRWDDMLNVLPPVQATFTYNGFQVGEPVEHRKCTVRPEFYSPTFSAFVRVYGRHYELSPSLTVAEFKAFDLGLIRQEQLVSDAAKAIELVDEDELEHYAAKSQDEINSEIDPKN
jgi:hypothetical protein